MQKLVDGNFTKNISPSIFSIHFKQTAELNDDP